MAQDDQQVAFTVTGSGRFGIVDLTGAKKKTKGTRPFVMAFVDIDDFTLDIRIKDFDRTLLMYLARRMSKANEVRLKQREIAAEMKTREARISEAIGRLRAAGYIETDGYGVIQLNPEVVWRHNVADNEELLGMR